MRYIWERQVEMDRQNERNPKKYLKTKKEVSQRVLLMVNSFSYFIWSIFWNILRSRSFFGKHPGTILYSFLYFSRPRVLTPELETPQLEGDEAVANLDKVYESIEVIGGQDEAVACAIVSPAAQQQISAQGVLQRSCQVLIEDWVQIVIVTAWKQKKKWLLIKWIDQEYSRLYNNKLNKKTRPRQFHAWNA